MSINPYSKVITDAFVFDRIAAVKVDGFFFAFFRKPLTLQNFATPLDYTTEGDNDKIDNDIIAWDFKQEADTLQCYAVKTGQIYRYTFTFDADFETVTVRATTKLVSNFDGSLYDVKVTGKEVVISCGDCSLPQVVFYDKDLNIFEGGTFNVKNTEAVPLRLAINY